MERPVKKLYDKWRKLPTPSDSKSLLLKTAVVMDLGRSVEEEKKLIIDVYNQALKDFQNSLNNDVFISGEEFYKNNFKNN